MKERSKLKILHVGCGNSSISEGLYREGYVNITNLDFCPDIIEAMREKTKEMKEMKWIGEFYSILSHLIH